MNEVPISVYLTNNIPDPTIFKHFYALQQASNAHVIRDLLSNNTILIQKVGEHLSKRNRIFM